MVVRVETRSFEVSSEGEGEVLDITRRVREAVAGSGLSDGVATVFVPGSTAAVTTIEFEPGLAKDFPAMLERAAPRKGVEYEHQRRWHDGNGHSHVKASLVGASLSVPFVSSAVPGDIVALTLQAQPGGTSTTTVTAQGPTTTTTATITGPAGVTTTTTTTTTVSSSGSNSTALYAVAAVAVIFIVVSGFLAMRGRKPAS